MGWLVPAVAVGLILSKLWWGCEMSSSKPSKTNPEDDIDHESAAYTRGQIHYLSMDSGMSNCWNSTVKMLFGLSCPTLAKTRKPELEVELAYILTSCFCMSVGAPPLHCRSHSGRDKDDFYHFSLIECATGKCFNKYDVDGFEINHRRIRDVCHYILDKNPTRQKESVPYTEDGDLTILKQVVSGDYYQQFDTKLSILLDIVTEEIQKRQEGIMFRVSKEIESLWLILDDIKFKLRIGNYAGVPYY